MLKSLSDLGFLNESASKLDIGKLYDKMTKEESEE